MAAAPTTTPVYPIDNAPIGTIGNAGGNYQGLILQQLQIMSILLREGLNIPQLECSTLVQQSIPVLSPSIAVVTQP